MYNERNENQQFVPSFTDDALLAELAIDASTKRLAKRFNVHERAIRKRLAAIRKKRNLPVSSDISREVKIAQLLQSVPTEGPNGSSVSEIDVKLWGVAAKDNEGKLQTQGLDGISARYKLRPSVPQLPFVERAQPSTFVYQKDSPRILRKIRRVVILSDAQIGFLLDEDGSHRPTHDPLAIDVAQQITADVAPDELGSIGDWVDFPMFSRWPKTAEQIQTTNKSTQAAHDILGEFIVRAGPRCKKKILVKGNHDDRPAIWARDTNLEAMGLRRASDTTHWPVLSPEYLMNLDSLGVEVTAPYPRGVWWITDDLCAMHAPPKKLEMAASVIHGHLHKLTRTTWAQTNKAGRVTYFLYDIGCLCEIDGTVPSDRPRTDWAQGIAIVEIIDGKFPIHDVRQIHINNGRSLFDGKEYVASGVPDLPPPAEEMAA